MFGLYLIGILSAQQAVILVKKINDELKMLEKLEKPALRTIQKVVGILEVDEQQATRMLRVEL